jgi:hypothetical protein
LALAVQGFERDELTVCSPALAVVSSRVNRIRRMIIV